MAVTIRPARLPQDAPGIAAIDTGFETSSEYVIEAEPRGFRLIETAIPRRTKRFGVYDLNAEEPEWDEAYVAEEGGRIVGFCASSWQFWNRRVVLWHIYVDPSHRETGLGQRLLETVYERARRQRALSIFLETSNLNVPGIAWYERRGFTLAGLDIGLYEGTGVGEEKAVYLMKRL